MSTNFVQKVEQREDKWAIMYFEAFSVAISSSCTVADPEGGAKGGKWAIMYLEAFIAPSVAISSSYEC